VYTKISAAELDLHGKQHRVYCTVVCDNLQESLDLKYTQGIVSQRKNTPCFFYGKINNRELAFALSRIGITDFVKHDHVENLIDKLKRIKTQSEFRVTVHDFGIIPGVHNNYWLHKFIQFLSQDYHFLDIRSINAAADRLGISREHLCRTLRKDCPLSPKQMQRFMKHYYAAYLLSTKPEWSIKKIAYRCKFSSEYSFYKSFHKVTGLTAQTFRREKTWRDFPSLYLNKVM